MFLELSEILRNVSLALAAPTGVYIAWRGLNSWKAESLWRKNDELAELLDSLFKLEQELMVAVRRHLAAGNPRNSDAMRTASARVKTRRDVLYEGDEDDKFGEEYQNLFQPIEEYLSTRLKI